MSVAGAWKDDPTVDELLKEIYRRRGRFDILRAQTKLGKIGRADLLIASIALAHRATLVTRNLRHFRQIPGLNTDNWAD